MLQAQIGFGTYKINDQKAMDDAIFAVFANGYDFIDCAKLYNNETLVGTAYHKASQALPHCKKPLLQSKIWPTDFKTGVLNNLQASLQRLQVSKLDSYLLHRPHVDNTYNVQAWKELLTCQQMGLVTYVGVSNFEPDMLQILYHETGVYPQICQNEGSLAYLRKDRIVFLKSHNISMQGWRPMGLLATFAKDSLVIAMAHKYQTDVPSLLLAYAQGFGFIPVVSATDPNYIANNKKALQIQISKEDLQLLENHCNQHKPTTHNGCDAYANLSLDEDWYLTH